MEIYIHCSVCKQYIYLHLPAMRLGDLRHLSISEFCLPSRNVFGLIALEGDLVVHGASWTVAALRHHPVPADVELLAVVRVREGGVRQCSSVGANHLALRTREAVVQRLCAEHHIKIVTESDCTFINTRVNTRVKTRLKTSGHLLRLPLEHHLTFGYNLFLPPSVPFPNRCNMHQF
jgi:hypothetical protein